MKKIKCLSLVLSLILIACPIKIFASSENSMSTEDELRVRNFLVENNVNSEDIEKLLKKYENGEIWDSLNPNVSSIRTEKYKKDNNVITKMYFPDGSVTVKEIIDEPNEDSISTRKVSGGTWSSGTGYRNCYGALVRVNHGVVDMSFEADFSIHQNNYDKINDVYHGDYFVAGGTVSNEVLRINQEWETSRRPAEAEYSITFNSYGSTSGWKYTLWLRVGNDTYWDDNQFWEK